MKSVMRALLVTVLVGTGLVALASVSSAAGGEQGELLLKGVGSAYGAASWTSLTEPVGSAGTFGLEVRNTGTWTAQYNLQVGAGSAGGCTCHATAVLTSGSLVVTPATEGPNGYFTAPIPPGGVAKYTLKVTPDRATTQPGDMVEAALVLRDTAGAPLGGVAAFNGEIQAYVQVARTTGTGGADQYVSGVGGSASTMGSSVSFPTATAPSVAVGKTFSFKIQLKNDGRVPAPIEYGLSIDPNQGCSPDNFPLKVTVGTYPAIDVTSAVLGSTYSTPTLAHGASVTLTVTGTARAGGVSCLNSVGESTAHWIGDTWNPTTHEFVYADLFFTPAAT